MTSLPFLEGLMPVQLFVEVALALGIFSLVPAGLERLGWNLNKLFQAAALFAFAIWYLRYRVYPPLPLNVVQTYATVAGLAIFGWVSSNEPYWQEVRRPIVAMLDGATPVARAVRVVMFVAMPVLVGVYAYDQMKPPDADANVPIELRTYNPAPPAQFQLYSPEDFKR